MVLVERDLFTKIHPLVLIMLCQTARNAPCSLCRGGFIIRLTRLEPLGGAKFSLNNNKILQLKVKLVINYKDTNLSSF